MPPTTRFYTMLVAFLVLSLQLLVQVHGQDTTSSTTEEAASPTSTATIFPGTADWTYLGCYNETVYLNDTGNARAIAGEIEARDDMTVESCLDFCRGKGMSKAGLEYTNECYCSNHVNALSNKLDDSDCDLACKGNETQICGGALRLSVYDKRSKTEGAASNIAQKAPSILALGIAMGTLLCLA